MKSFSIMVISLFVFAFFTQCGSAQFDKNPPFTIYKAYYQDWFGGQPGSKGTFVQIELAGPISKDIVFDSVFFRKDVTKLDLNIIASMQTLKGNIISKSHEDRNIVMHSDPKEEMVNEVRGATIQNPFEISDNECVISYFIKKKKHYYKVENLKKEKPIYYP
ncbi:MAG: hypothetical protein KJO83_00900 [Bacteroidia bacterium]|nr:hypothetical protein [Bacteroidia bacterium]